MQFGQWLNENAQEHLAFQMAIRRNYNDKITRSVYADYLQERDLATEEVLNFLRNSVEPASFLTLPNGKIWVGRCYTMTDIVDHVNRTGHGFFSANTMRYFGSRLTSWVGNIFKTYSVYSYIQYDFC